MECVKFTENSTTQFKITSAFRERTVYWNDRDYKRFDADVTVDGKPMILDIPTSVLRQLCVLIEQGHSPYGEYEIHVKGRRLYRTYEVRSLTPLKPLKQPISENGPVGGKQKRKSIRSLVWKLLSGKKSSAQNATRSQQ